MQTNVNAGFTLIELLVVVLIIGVLAAVALPQYTKAVEKSRTAEVVTLLGDVMTGERIYQLSQGEYTTDLSALDIDITGVNVSNFSASMGINGDGSVTMSATRINGGSANGYILGANMTLDGVITRYCDDADSNVKICSSMPDWEPFPEEEETGGTTANVCPPGVKCQN